tara:strand:+ start:92 stop:322 length:231 start_codon:yes stop_codon:yes gene_type:complete
MNLEANNGNSYNNADSFAFSFDAAWNEFEFKNNKELNLEEKIKMTFDKIKSHPFLIENPIQSRNIALFRIKLLGLS